MRQRERERECVCVCVCVCVCTCVSRGGWVLLCACAMETGAQCAKAQHRGNKDPPPPIVTGASCGTSLQRRSRGILFGGGGWHTICPPAHDGGPERLGCLVSPLQCSLQCLLVGVLLRIEGGSPSRAVRVEPGLRRERFGPPIIAHNRLLPPWQPLPHRRLWHVRRTQGTPSGEMTPGGQALSPAAHLLQKCHNGCP